MQTDLAFTEAKKLFCEIDSRNSQLQQYLSQIEDLRKRVQVALREGASCLTEMEKAVNSLKSKISTSETIEGLKDESSRIREPIIQSKEVSV